MSASDVMPSTWSISKTERAFLDFPPFFNVRNSFSLTPITRLQSTQSITFHCLPVFGFSALYRTLLMNILRLVCLHIGRRLLLSNVRSFPSVMPVMGSICPRFVVIICTPYWAGCADKITQISGSKLITTPTRSTSGALVSLGFCSPHACLVDCASA